MRDICTICGRHGHSASSCTSDIGSFLRKSGNDLAPSAKKTTSTTAKKTSRESPTGITDADAPAHSSEQKPKSLPMAEHYSALMTDSVEALGSQRAVANWLGLVHGTLQYRLEHPKMVKREHCLALEYLLERVNR